MRTSRRGVDAAPGTFYFCTKLVATLHQRGKGRARSGCLGRRHQGMDRIPQQHRLSIADVMGQRDPDKIASGIHWCGVVPVAEHGFLHPLKIDGIVDVPLLVDVGRRNDNGQIERRCDRRMKRRPSKSPVLNGLTYQWSGFRRLGTRLRCRAGKGLCPFDK